eukprot:2880069-Rhodomonas_salina.4
MARPWVGRCGASAKPLRIRSTASLLSPARRRPPPPSEVGPGLRFVCDLPVFVSVVCGCLCRCRCRCLAVPLSRCLAVFLSVPRPHPHALSLSNSACACTSRHTPHHCDPALHILCALNPHASLPRSPSRLHHVGSASRPRPLPSSLLRPRGAGVGVRARRHSLGPRHHRPRGLHRPRPLARRGHRGPPRGPQGGRAPFPPRRRPLRLSAAPRGQDRVQPLLLPLR